MLHNSCTNLGSNFPQSIQRYTNMPHCRHNSRTGPAHKDKSNYNFPHIYWHYRELLKEIRKKKRCLEYIVLCNNILKRSKGNLKLITQESWFILGYQCGFILGGLGVVDSGR